MKALTVLGAAGALAIAGTAKAVTPDTTINFSDKSQGNVIADNYGNSGNVTTKWTGSPTVYGSGYSTLSNVVYGPGATSTITLELTAGSGYQVLLKSFDLADYYSQNLPATLTVSVNGGAATAVPGSSNPILGGATYSSFTGLTYVGNSIKLSITENGSTQDLGLDNIVYGQQAVAVPEPAALSLLGLGVLGLIRRRQNI